MLPTYTIICSLIVIDLYISQKVISSRLMMFHLVTVTPTTLHTINTPVGGVFYIFQNAY
jgi:hypothetical protein